MKPFALHGLCPRIFRLSPVFFVMVMVTSAITIAACDTDTSTTKAPAPTIIPSALLSYTTINVDEAKSLIQDNPDLVVLDVRTQGEYKTSHLPNAVLIPLFELPGRLIELDKDKKILVYCKTGIRSAQASKILINNGFGTVYNMPGGIDAWIKAGYPVDVGEGN